MLNETWLPIPTFPQYAVSNLGRVKRVAAARGARVGRIMRLRKNPDGYLCVTLKSTEKRQGFLVNRLVCEAFIGPAPTPAHQAAHRDGVRDNNRLCNLRWATPAENNADKLQHGTASIGEGHWKSKLTDADIINIRRDSRRQKDIAGDYGVTQSLVSMVKSGKVWAHLATAGDQS